ncbi:hypothetical protein AAF712_009775 [Marasmius tenuissimus]|uniref:Cytochrome b561 domain-containing protein n=1 Tax=Marasmius tenuissimus TaxID=585030 RepID=A0ABR2ZPP3_9AGAR
MPGVSNEYELLPSNQDQESQPTMGTEEQRSNAEAREGDQWAQYVALVRPHMDSATPILVDDYAILGILWGILDITSAACNLNQTLGILSMVWILMQVALGGASVWFNGAAFGGGAKAKAVWKYHRLSGYLLFPLLLLTVNLGGAWSHWGQRHISYTIRVLVYVISPAAVLTAVVSRVRLSKMKFI